MPSSLLIKHALRTAITIAIAGAFVQESNFAGASFMVISLVIVMQTSLVASIQTKWEMLAGLAIACGVGSLLISSLGPSPVTGGLAYILAILPCYLYRLTAIAYLQAGLFSVLIATATMGAGENLLLFTLQLFAWSWGGALIGIAVMVLFWPDNPSKTLSENLVQVLHHNDRLFQGIIAGYLHGEYQESAISHLITETEENIQQSQSLLRKSMFGHIGTKLTQEDWSERLYTQHRLCRSLLFLFNDLKTADGEHLVSQLKEELLLLTQQVSDFCQKLSQFIESRDAYSLNKLSSLVNSWQQVMSKVGQMRTTGETINYSLQEVKQFYTFLYNLHQFIQNLEQLASQLSQQEKVVNQQSIKAILRYSPVSTDQLKHIIKVGVTIGLSLAILDNFAQLPYYYYAPLAIIVVMQPTLGNVIAAGWSRIICTTVGALFAILLINTLGANPLTLGLAIALTILTCSLLGFPTGYLVGCLLITITMLSHANNPNAYIWSRWLETSLGVIMAVIVSLVFWVNTASDQLDKSLAQTLKKIGKLYETIINNYLETNTEKDIKDLRQQIQESIQTHSALQAQTKQESIDNLTSSRKQHLWNFLISHQKELFYNILNLENAVQHKESGEFYQEFQKELQESVQTTVQGFNDLSLAVASQTKQPQLPPLLPSFEEIDRKLLKRRTENTIARYTLNEAIPFFAVFSNMKEIAENLRQMAENWPSYHNQA